QYINELSFSFPVPSKIFRFESGCKSNASFCSLQIFFKVFFASVPVKEDRKNNRKKIPFKERRLYLKAGAKVNLFSVPCKLFLVFFRDLFAKDQNTQKPPEHPILKNFALSSGPWPLLQSGCKYRNYFLFPASFAQTIFNLFCNVL
ncbi:hypothetical protein, partial [Galbibacter mesophilus]|uniref:hypothetical protein n=1 Tax=Galbibacter mesophilus TaxID=379069 RepID=UPI002043AD43